MVSEARLQQIRANRAKKLKALKVAYDLQYRGVRHAGPKARRPPPPTVEKPDRSDEFPGWG